MQSSTIERARGRWREILPRLGLAPSFLVNKHGPCPICGGKDRYRFDDKDGAGTYFCGQCGPGAGIILVQRVNGWDFKTAADAVDEIIGTDAPIPPAAADHRDDSVGRLRRVERVLSQAGDFTIVEQYLPSRGLSVYPDILRGHTALAYRDDGRLVGRYPAVLAPVTGPDGSLQSAHRVYLADVEPRKKLMVPVTTVKGGAVRLFEPGEVLGIAEGIETAIACHQRDGLPVWSVISTAGMEAFTPPEGVWRVVIYGDNDENFAGQKAAITLANRLVRERFTVDVRIPPEPGTDWLDVLNSGGVDG